MTAARTSPFYWRNGYAQQLDWTNGQRSAKSRIVATKEMVAGQDYEPNDTPRTGSMRDGNNARKRRGELGARKMKEARQ